MVGAFLTERGMEFQMKTDDQDHTLARSWIAVGAKVCTGRLIPEGMLVDQMKEPYR